MKSDVISIVDKVDMRSTVRTLRAAVIAHFRALRREGATQGIFLSRTPSGTVVYDSFGMTAEEKIALIENAKYLMQKDLWG